MAETFAKGDKLPPLPPGAHYQVVEVKRNRFRLQVVGPELKPACEARRKLETREPSD